MRKTAKTTRRYEHWKNKGYDDDEGQGVRMYCPKCTGHETHLRSIQHLALPYENYVKELAMFFSCADCDEEFYVVFAKRNVNEKTYIYYADDTFIEEKINAAKQDINLLIAWSEKRNEHQ